MNGLPNKKLIQSIYSPPLLDSPRTDDPSQVLETIYRGVQRQTFSLARHALKTGLSALGLKAGDRVLIPSFICRDVLAPFHVLGIEVLFYSLGEDLLIDESIEKLPKAEAIMAVHYFGLETDLTPFRKYCGLHGAFLIEDNAHGFLSESQSGPLGTHGDIGIVSLRKSLPILNGALLLADKKVNLPPSLPVQILKSTRLQVKNILRPLVSRFGVGFLLKLTQFKRSLRYLIKGSLVPTSDKEDEHHIPFAPNSIDVRSYIFQMDLEKEKKRRRDLFEAFSKLLSDPSVRPLRCQLTPFEVPYVFPFFCSKENIDRIERLIRSAGTEVVHWPALPEAVEGHEPEFYNNLYLVKFLW